MSRALHDDPRLVPEAWSRVARGYKAYWSPRFRPFVEAAIDRFEPATAGPLVVPGCGPGDEVMLLANRHPRRSIVAMDVSPAMLGLVWETLRQRRSNLVLATYGPAEDVSSAVREAGGVFSSFVLQLLPDPLAALADWSRALRVGGTVAALFWPRGTPRPDAALDPFSRLHRLIATETGVDRQPWEEAAAGALHGLGFEVTAQETIEHSIEHPSPEECLRQAIESGSLQATLERHGRQVLERCGSLWLRDHGLERRGSVWLQPARASLWCLRKIRAVPEQH